jgi:hypothetical protein
MLSFYKMMKCPQLSFWIVCRSLLKLQVASSKVEQSLFRSHETTIDKYMARQKQFYSMCMIDGRSPNKVIFSVTLRTVWRGQMSIFYLRRTYH